MNIFGNPRRQTRNSIVTKILPALGLLACTALAEDARVTSLMQEELARNGSNPVQQQGAPISMPVD